MKTIASALALTLGLLAATSFAPADAARRGGNGGSVCFEKGCKGSQCIFCER